MTRLTFAILLLIASIGVFFFGVVPAWNDGVALRSDIAGLTSVNDELQSIAKARDDLTQQYNAIPQADLTKLSRIVPSDNGTAQFLRDTEALANHYSLFLKNLDFTQQAKQGVQVQLGGQKPYATIGVTMTVRGTYDSLRLFLRDLEKTVRMTDISDISFSTAVQPGQANIFEYALKGSIYYLR